MFSGTYPDMCLPFVQMFAPPLFFVLLLILGDLYQKFKLEHVLFSHKVAPLWENMILMWSLLSPSKIMQ